MSKVKDLTNTPAGRLYSMLDDIDTLSDQIKPVDLQGYKSFFKHAIDFSNKRHLIFDTDGYGIFELGAMPKNNDKPVTPSGDEPVYTQPMNKAGQRPPVGSTITYHVSPRDDEGRTVVVLGHHCEWMWVVDESNRFDHITMDVVFSFPDNLTDEEKLRDAIELSRPIGERKQDHTVDGVTKYAIEMLPIDYVQNITPLVADDLIYNSSTGRSSAVVDGEIKELGETLNPHLFIVSFADRPNTGTQPIGRDVVVSTNWNEELMLIAGVVCWAIDKEGETWKPNHAAMLKQYQAEQVRDNEMEVLSIAGTPLETLSQFADKPFFTQAMKDAGELPQVGAEFIDTELCNGESKNSQTALFHHDDRVIYCAGDDDYLSANPADCQPIDNRTPEEKAIDDMHKLDVYGCDEVILAIKAGKIHGVTWNP